MTRYYMWNYRVHPYIHFSVDDTIQVFADLKRNEKHYRSIFDNKMLFFWKQLHERYGAVVSFYCYYCSGEMSLDQMPDKFAVEFAMNSDWLKFGVHAFHSSIHKESDDKDYTIGYIRVVRELLRITGTANSIDRMPRLDYYMLPEAAAIQLKSMRFGIYGLLGADDERISYYLSEKDSQKLKHTGNFVDKHGICFLRTDIRLEHLRSKAELDEICTDWNRKKPLIIFTHEWSWNQDIEEYILTICENLYQTTKFDFPMNYANVNP